MNRKKFVQKRCAINSAEGEREMIDRNSTLEKLSDVNGVPAFEAFRLGVL